MGVHDYLLMTRVFTTFGHLTVTLILFQTVSNNVNLSFPDSANSNDVQIAYQTAMGALAFSLLCFLVDVYGAISGSSTFSVSINLMQILFHFIGCIFLSWLITNNWNYQALWPIVISSNLPTALAEIFQMLVVKVFRAGVF